VGEIAGVTVIVGSWVSFAAGVEVGAWVLVGVWLGRRVGLGEIASFVIAGIAVSTGVRVAATGASVGLTCMGRGSGAELQPERLAIKIITPPRYTPININFLCMIPLLTPVRLGRPMMKSSRIIAQSCIRTNLATFIN
jgi:hypothetical protein